MGSRIVMGESKIKTVLFYRNFQKFTGGHLKVWHYFNHIKASANYTPQVYFTPNSVMNESNPWWQSGEKAIVTTSLALSDANVLFIGNIDWRAIPAEFLEAQRVPIINIVQGLHHADPKSPAYKFLKNWAIRICVSSEIETALRAVPHLNGPPDSYPDGTGPSQPAQSATGALRCSHSCRKSTETRSQDQ